MVKILIVEDDEFLADLMQDCLSASAHDVKSVGTGGAALKELENGTFEVVLLDWQLPDMEGLDVLKQYRSNNGAAKVVMLTGMRGRKEDGIMYLHSLSLFSMATGEIYLPALLLNISFLRSVILRNLPSTIFPISPV